MEPEEFQRRRGIALDSRGNEPASKAAHVDAMNDRAVRKHLKILGLQTPDTGWLEETRKRTPAPGERLNRHRTLVNKCREAALVRDRVLLVSA
jgi:hypothetical protein